MADRRPGDAALGTCGCALAGLLAGLGALVVQLGDQVCPVCDGRLRRLKQRVGACGIPSLYEEGIRLLDRLRERVGRVAEDGVLSVNSCSPSTV